MYEIIKSVSGLIIKYPDPVIPSISTFIVVNPTLDRYQQFLSDWQNGATVLSSEGNPLAYGDQLS